MPSPISPRLLFSALMSLQMSLLMTCWITLINLGFSDQFFSRWMHAFTLAWPAAFFIVLLTAPAVQRLTQRLLDAVRSLKGVRA
ncbi:DUF2798 domain-containing protein [Burkholderiaceae bacterium DAT-1]|nr:DUF2798 domain-containing protein [Burkholderiaceae bacterium DAT-1]